MIAARGFGLLESLVALTLLASTGLALFAWINQNLQTASALRDRVAGGRLQLEALALLEGVNPARQSEGRLQTQAIELSWRAELVEPVRGNATFSPPETGPWLVGLYRLSVEARDVVTGRQRSFVALQAGTRRIVEAVSGPAAL